MMPVQAGGPARKVVTGRRTGSLTGYHPSRKMGRGVPFESMLELDALTVLEVDHTVMAFATQPETFAWRGPDGRARRYTPDLLVTTAVSRTFKEVKPQRRLMRDLSLGGRRERIGEECAACGACFEVWTDVDIRREPRLSNSRAVLREGLRMADRFAEDAIRDLPGPAGTVAEISEASGLPVARALRTIMRLTVFGMVAIDLDGPLGPLTKVFGGGWR